MKLTKNAVVLFVSHETRIKLINYTNNLTSKQTICYCYRTGVRKAQVKINGVASEIYFKESRLL